MLLEMPPEGSEVERATERERDPSTVYNGEDYGNSSVDQPGFEIVLVKKRCGRSVQWVCLSPAENGYPLGDSENWHAEGKDVG